MDATFKKRKNPLIPSDVESYSDQSDLEEIVDTQKTIKVFDRY